MEAATTSAEQRNTLNIAPESPRPGPNPEAKPKIVVIMGPTGAGKSKLAIDLASHFPIEIINADSMQVYRGLDVLTNKVTVEEQKGVPHHLLGTISANVEFTAKDFRDLAIPLINEIWSRNCLPVIVGGTNYYIQALVSQYLLDVEDVELSCLSDHAGDQKPDLELEPTSIDDDDSSYNRLKDLDRLAANRIHPNNHRKINQFLRLYARFGVLPSKLLQENVIENWGLAENFRYNCCFICVDASLPALDQFVERRVDRMVDAGLLDEVIDIYELNADYTRGLRQAIGVREFENVLQYSSHEFQNTSDAICPRISDTELLKETVRQFMDSPSKTQQKIMLTEAIDRVKLNTRRLVRRQKRRLNRLQMLFGWNIHYVDVTGCLSGASEDMWKVEVVEPSVEIVKFFLQQASMQELISEIEGMKLAERDLWSHYVCEACGNKVLRGAHEWEQHKQGRRHRKRVSRLKKSCLSVKS